MADRKGRLPKVTQACDTCRARKTKCDGANPCANCVQHGFSCAFDVTQTVSAPKKRKRTDRPAVHPPGPHLQTAGSSTKPLSLVSSAPSADSADDLLRRPSQPEVYPQSAIEHDLAKTLDDIRVHAESREFHGPSGILSFLSKLRSKAQQARSHVSTPGSANSESTLPDWASSSASTSGQYRPSGSSSINPQAIGPDITRFCVEQYFQNSHLIHPFIDQSRFLPHSDKIIGNRTPAEIPLSHSERHFVALYFAVAALGAITAPDDSLYLKSLASNRRPSSSISRDLSATYFSLSKQYLGDTFESTSIDSVSTLFLLAVYSQTALRPHSCYQYSGMAVRSALAIGLPSSSGPSTSEIRRCLWWALYAHELEVCSSVGRSPALLEPHSYTIAMPAAPFDTPTSIIEPMVAFSAVLGEISKQIYKMGSDADSSQRSRTTMDFNYRLEAWRASLPPALHPDITTLQAPEWRLKQKLILNLRFHNARILLHRPFLLSLGSSSLPPWISDHIRICVDASQATIAILHSAYLVHPYFRTWWYNTTYALYATLVLLYVLLSGDTGFSDDELLQSVRQAFDVLESMKAEVVASRCADVVREVLAVVTQLVTQRRQVQPPPPPMGFQPTLPSPEMEFPMHGGEGPGSWAFDGDLFGNLVDPEFIDSLLQADLWMGAQSMM